MRFRDMILTDEQKYPYAPECAVHNTVDNGFSRGFGAHFHPVPEYFVDCHVHYASALTGQPLLDAVGRYQAMAAPLGIRKLVLLPPVSVSSQANARIQPGDVRRLNPHLELELTDPGLAWLIYLRHDMPDENLVREAIEKGCRGLKLHMAPMVVTGADYRTFLNPAWKRVFTLLEQHGLPVLFHVTQYIGGSRYKNQGGDDRKIIKNRYFSEGWDQGITYTNEDLLTMFLQLVSTHPGIPFIGAHELYMGLDRLDDLLDKHANLHIDASGGFLLNDDDDFYPRDRDLYKQFVIKQASRILYASDAATEDYVPREQQQALQRCRIRFIKRLQLPDEPLQLVCHRNTERIFGF
jgi:predicted TIM-barrel fold metal-dependent hydrolase